MRRSLISFLLLFYLIPIHFLFSQDWQAPFSIQVDEWSTSLYLGCHSGASDGYDAHMDTLAPPPAFSPYAIFYISAFPNYLQTDIRLGDLGTIWNMRTFNCAGKQVKIKWDLRDLESFLGKLQLKGVGIIATKDSITRSGDLDLVLELVYKTGFANSHSTELPASFTLEIFPNPAREKVSIISHDVQSQELTIYNFLGVFIKTLAPVHRTLVSTRFEWDGRDETGILAPNGIYWVLLKTQSGFEWKFLTLIR